jgi:ferredoxin
MTRIRFVSADGTRTTEADGKPGERLLDIAQAHGQPLEGACEGAMACSTCHVFIAPEQFGLLPQPSEAEEDMLDFAPHASRYSRLACQIVLGADLPELTVRMPPGSVDARR